MAVNVEETQHSVIFTISGILPKLIAGRTFDGPTFEEGGDDKRKVEGIFLPKLCERQW